MLKEHMRVHDNIREYLCAECGKGACTRPDAPGPGRGLDATSPRSFKGRVGGAWLVKKTCRGHRPSVRGPRLVSHLKGDSCEEGT